MKKLFTIISLTLAVITNAQNTFTAKVMDSRNSEVLIGASIILKGTINGASTDVNGLTTLKNIPNGEQVISISFIGYEAKDLHLNFQLKIKKRIQSCLLLLKQKLMKL